MRSQVWSVLLLACAGLMGAAGCTTESYCFSDCEGQPGSGGSSGSRWDGGDPDGMVFDSGTGGIIIIPDSGPLPDGCLDQELCNGIDDNCNGEIDEGIDYSRPQHCGTCANDCTRGGNLVNPTCDPPSVLDGTQAGTCRYERCADDFYDLDGDPSNGCEYYCIHNPNGTNTTDPGGVNGCGKDDDCDGQIDEDVDTCGDVENCGRCGKRCVIANGTARCASSAGSGESCTEANTRCEVDQCDPGFYDVDGSPDNGCEYQCTPTGPEVCDGVDNDCDGRIDNVDADLENAPGVGEDCFGGTQGVCASSAHRGIRKCIGGALRCCDVSSNAKTATNPNLPATGVRNGICDGDTAPFVVTPGELQETCNGLDDDCNGQVDDQTIDSGATCGSSVGSCSVGTLQCELGTLQCRGATAPTADVCNGRDDNCDGVIDGVVVTPAVPCTTDAACSGSARCINNLCTLPAQGMGVACDVPPATPPGATSPCRAGVLQCLGGSPTCVGSIRPTTSVDTCGVDANCDGTLSNQPDLQNDPRNCGSCGNDCTARPGNGAWGCSAGACVFNGCRPGFIECGGAANDCETPCSGSPGATEICNGIDDNCDCQVDNVLPANRPSPTQVCGVSTAATDPSCTTGVNVACNAGAWRCTFPSGYCTGTAPNYCTNPDNTCNNRDDNCNGTIDDDFQLAVVGPSGNYLGKACNSDDNLPISHGVCQGQGTYQCNPTNPAQTRCTATKQTHLASPELCDGKDNDCDGDVDETKFAPGSEPSYVVPAVRQIASTGVFMYMYEASRPGATATNPGQGNGWHSNPPSTDTADETLACSVPGVVPWFNVTPSEAAQTCAAVGGRLCELSDWQRACRGPSNTCTRGYAPAAACTSNGNYPQGNPHCNIGLYDWDGNASNGITDGLLPTAYTGGGASPTLTNCRADWSGNDDYFDIMGNLREITWNRTSPGSNGCTPENPTDPNCLFSLMGGAFNTQSEDGAACGFTFYTVNSQFKLFDVGFRCCFDSNPQ
ncbi:MAG: hypothetical protein KIT72_19470 [Polyangiaceae bacterium]|nr:hypothetical protein [Polyangiaceae bacterium]MCW5792601.1 hypothetical protein [Polyangiaceae bacterium]